MAAKLNTEFNYRYQVVGETPWEKIKTLKGFLEGRERAADLEQVSKLKYQAKVLELEHAKKINALPHVIINMEAELLECNSFKKTEEELYELNRKEIAIIKKVLKELYEIVEPTRQKHSDGTVYSDEEMFELNAANEFTAMIGKEILGDIMATGRPSSAKLKNAMSNPYTFNALKQSGILPPMLEMVEANPDPTKIQLNFKVFNDLNTLNGMKLAWDKSVTTVENTPILTPDFYKLQ